MLHLDPSKRIPLSGVLKHRWMQGADTETQLIDQLRVFGSSDNLLWNEQVLLAIQQMNYDVERCKMVCECNDPLPVYEHTLTIIYLHTIISHAHTQAVQNRSYDDHAAIYYLLLNKWERGQLRVLSSRASHPRLSHSGVPSMIPQISIQNAGSQTSNSPPINPFQNPGMLQVDERREEAEEFMKDPNLARYLQHGRRHTLGAAHNHMFMAPEDLDKLRQISEHSSSQASDGLGLGSNSSTNCVTGVVGSTTLSSLQQALSTGVPVINNSSQNNVNGPKRHYIPPSRNRMERRMSDATPYATAYRLYIEKRNPQLAQINSNSSVNREDSSSISSASSVKMLLQEKKAFGEVYGGLPAHRQWLQYKNHVSLCTLRACNYKYAYTSCTLYMLYIMHTHF